MSARIARPGALKSALAAGGFALALLASAPAFAQTTPEEAARIQKLLQDAIATQAGAQPGLVTEGDVVVVPSGSAYDVTMPRIKMEDPEQGFTLDMGVTKMQVEPANSDGIFAYTATLDQMTVLDDAGQPQAQVKIGSQDIDGTWDSETNIAQDVSIDLDDIDITIVDGSAEVEIGKVTYDVDMTEDSNGRMSGPSEGRVTDIAIRAPDGSQSLTIDSASVKGNVEDMDMLAYRDAAHEMAAFAQAQGEAPPTEMPPGLFKMLGALGDMSTEFRLEGLAMDSNDGTRVRLASADFGGGLEGTSEDKSNVNFTMGHEGLELTVPDAMAAELPTGLVPTRSRIAVTLANIPNDKAAAAFAQFEQDAQTVGPDVAGMNFAGQMQPLLSEGGAQVRLDTFEVEMPDAGVTGKGTADFNAEAVAGMVANFDFAVRGLEKVTADLREQSKTPEGTVSNEYAELLMGLGALQGFGRPETGLTGTTHNYKIEVGPGGDVEVNDVPMTNLGGAEGMPQ